jgi:hypothetical protein
MVSSTSTPREPSRVRMAAALVRSYFGLPAVARREWRLDSLKLARRERDAVQCVDAALDWLCSAQDCSASADGGVARHYSLVSGWAPSYPETTGYIVPTFVECARLLQRSDLRERARRMLDWLVSIQFEDGGFPGGTVGADPHVPVTFNTGQILIGLSAGVREFGGAYRNALLRAADWLEYTQDPDGCWRSHPSPFVAEAGAKVYDVHAAWGLLEAARVEPHSRYADAALANIRWAVRHQEDDGWFRECCLEDPDRPLTHTIGYTLRGLIEAYRFAKEPDLLERSTKTADALLGVMSPSGFLPGRLNRDWRGTVRWSCLTGTVQIAACWFLLYEMTGDSRYREAGVTANAYVRRTMKLYGAPGTHGGVKGCYPTFGDYGRNEYLNWACKFFIDSSLMEFRIGSEQGSWLGNQDHSSSRSA